MTDFLLMVGGALFAMFISGIVNYKKSVWVDLTDDEIEMIVENRRASHWEFVRQVEDILREKNT